MDTQKEYVPHKYTELSLIVDNVKLTFLNCPPKAMENPPNPKPDTTIHAHFYFELFYAWGDFSIIIAGQEIPMKKGEVIVIAPNTYHTAKYIGSTPAWGFPFNLKPHKPKETSRLYNELLQSFSKEAYSKYEEDEKTTKIIEDLVIYSKSDSSDKHHLMTAKFYELIFALKARRKSVTDKITLAAETANEPDIDIDAYICRFVKDPDISLDKIADAVNMSATQVNRIIKKKTGLTFRQYVITLRMLNATHLLKESDLKVTQIPEQVGYRSVHGFYTAFRKAFHCTPEEYRSNTEQVCLPASTGNLIRSAASAAQD